MAQLICDDVTLGYEGKTVTEHLSFSVNAGDYLCIVGENGAGKSTLMNVLFGLYQPDEGVIKKDGREVKINNPNEHRGV